MLFAMYWSTCSAARVATCRLPLRTDSLVLRDTTGEFVQAGQQGAAVTVERRSSSSYRVVADPADAPYLLVV